MRLHSQYASEQNFKSGNTSRRPKAPTPDRVPDACHAISSQKPKIEGGPPLNPVRGTTRAENTQGERLLDSKATAPRGRRFPCERLVSNDAAMKSDHTDRANKL